MQKLLFTLALFFLFFAKRSAGQSPYNLTWQKEPLFYGAGMVGTGLGQYFSIKVNPLSPEEVSALDRNEVNGFDRPATYNLSQQAEDWSDALLIGSHAAPMILLTGQRSRCEFGRIALLYGEVYLLNLGITQLAKSLSLRTRPLAYNEEFSDQIKLKKNVRFSFFSGHTSISAANMFFFAKVFSDYYPDSRLKPLVWTAAVVYPAVTGYLRVAAGKHFPTDVIAGYGVGAAIGFLVPHFHKNPTLNKRLSFYPGFGGGTFVMRL